MPNRLYTNSLKNKLVTLNALVTFLASISFLFLLLLFSRSALAYEPRFFLWGLAGSKGLARIDWLLPVYSEPCSCLVYTDIQGEMDTETNWYGGIGVGHRTRIADRLYGGYAYVDRNYSSWHNAYYILSPGAETLGERWDARVNAYIPVSKKKFSQVGEPLLQDTCGDNFNCDNTFFTGHQQFLKLFKKVEEVGTGLDMELGFHLGSHRNIDFYGGAYYFHFSENEDIKGLETRLVVPVRSAVALTVEASYDNEHHGTIMGGIRLQSGHLSHAPVVLEDHFYDPIPRNLGTIHNGLGVPVSRRHKFDRDLLIRDNIFFFTATGGGAFTGVNSGTFENPLAASELAQTTIDGINLLVPNANLYFNSGTYIIEPAGPDAPNASVVLSDGQSIFGRTFDYRCSANGDERPLLLGGIELLEGSHHIDSIILNNSIINPTIVGGEFSLTALTILDAPNVSICNSVFNANISITTPATGNVFATGIRLDNSIVAIDSSSINASISILGDNELTAAVVGIGAIGADVNTSRVNIQDSLIKASSTVLGEINNTSNYAVGIGTIAVGPMTTANFSNNNFTLSDTPVISQAGALGLTSNLNSFAAGIGSIAFSTGAAATANFETNQFIITDGEIRSAASGNNNLIFATGIGGNAVGGNAEFISNEFTITDSEITASGNVPTFASSTNIFLLSTAIGGNAFDASNAEFMNNTFNLSSTALFSSGNSNTPEPASVAVTGIGGNSTAADGIANFDDNRFSLDRSSIFSSTLSGVDTVSFTTAIGGNALTGVATSGQAEFIDNSFSIASSQLKSVGFKNEGANLLNFVSVVGGNAQATGNADMIHTVMTIDASTIDAQAINAFDNVSSNFATGIGGNSETGTNAEILDSVFIVTNNVLNVLATALNNSGENRAVGLIADAGSIINFSSSVGLVRAIIQQANIGINTAIPFIQNGGGVVNGGGSIQAQTSP